MKCFFSTPFSMWVLAAAFVLVAQSCVTTTTTCTNCHSEPVMVTQQPTGLHVSTPTPTCDIPQDYKKLGLQLVYSGSNLIGSVKPTDHGIEVYDTKAEASIASFTLNEGEPFKSASWPEGFETLQSARWILCEKAIYFTWPDAPKLGGG
jgi:hypothetical protein